MENLFLNQRINYRNIMLFGGKPGCRVGYLSSGGKVNFVPWCGFLTREHARSIPNGQPVRIVEMSRFGVDTYSGIEWRDIEKNLHVHGCLTPRGIFAVVDISIATIDVVKLKSP